MIVASLCPLGLVFCLIRPQITFDQNEKTGKAYFFY